MNHRVTVGLLAIVGSCPLALAQHTIESKDSLQEVVVTGTGTQHLLKDAPVQTEVISRQALRNFAGRSIEDILSQLSSSFDFEQGDMGSQMQMNGLGNSYILIMIDGKRLHGDVGGQNDLGLIDPNNIERIEIVKGASSALYGSDAIAGVINIITRKHDEGIMLEDKTRYGAYNDVRQHNGVALRWGKISSYTNFQLLATKQTKGDFPERGTQQGNARWLCATSRTRGTDRKGDNLGRAESRGHRHADDCDYRE